MAEENQGAQPTEPIGTEPHGSKPGEPQKDWRAEYEKAIAQSRKWEQRAKENKDAAAKLSELEDASKTDAEKLADAVKRAESAEQRLAEYERAAERAGTVADIAAETGVDADWLGRMAGDTAEEIRANADFLASKLSGAAVYPSVTDNGAGKRAGITREQIEAIRDPKERVLTRAKHLDLYK